MERKKGNLNSPLILKARVSRVRNARRVGAFQKTFQNLPRDGIDRSHGLVTSMEVVEMGLISMRMPKGPIEVHDFKMPH